MEEGGTNDFSQTQQMPSKDLLGEGKERNMIHTAHISMGVAFDYEINKIKYGSP